MCGRSTICGALSWIGSCAIETSYAGAGLPANSAGVICSFVAGSSQRPELPHMFALLLQRARREGLFAAEFAGVQREFSRLFH